MEYFWINQWRELFAPRKAYPPFLVGIKHGAFVPPTNFNLGGLSYKHFPTEVTISGFLNVIPSQGSVSPCHFELTWLMHVLTKSSGDPKTTEYPNSRFQYHLHNPRVLTATYIIGRLFSSVF